MITCLRHLPQAIEERYIHMDYTLIKQVRIIATDNGAHLWRLVEPTISSYLHIQQTLEDKINLSHFKGWLIDHYLYSGPAETVSSEELTEVIGELCGMITQQVLKPWKKKDAAKGKKRSVADLALLRSLDVVGRRYGILPHDLCRRITMRQLHYLYQIAYNGTLDDQEWEISLHGGKVKQKEERLELLAEDLPQDTSAMTPQEKAAYYSRLRREEGRQPGRM